MTFLEVLKYFEILKINGLWIKFLDKQEFKTNKKLSFFTYILSYFCFGMRNRVIIDQNEQKIFLKN